ncbi:hypothetical protein ACO1LU_14495, partial [Staphylococcus aureus]
TIGVAQTGIGLSGAPLSVRIVLLSTFCALLAAAMAQRFFAYGRNQPFMASVCLLGGSIAGGHALFMAAIALLVAFGPPTPSPLDPN